MENITAAKVEQAVGLLPEFGLDAWLVQFGRETYDHPSPVQRLAVGTSVTWPAAFAVASDGSSVAIVGTGDVSNVTRAGVYDEVVGYVKDIGPDLRAWFERHDPHSIGLSVSRDDDQADSLTHGMYLLLLGILDGTPYAERLRSADNLVVALRARKLPAEIDSIRAAIGDTLALFDLIERMLRPGVTERDVADAVHERIANLGLETAWEAQYCPIVNFGPESAFGHAAPSDIALEPGMVVHVDLGVKRDGYCSDLQRCWYILRPGESDPPEEVTHAFSTVVRSMEAGFAALRPGAPGREVDAAAREVIVAAGYEEPQFALGHQLGQSTHDGGGLLGPPWPRYGNRPHMAVEAGNVFTLEYGLSTPAGTIGLEEDVLVTDSGAEYLSPPQTELRCLRL